MAAWGARALALLWILILDVSCSEGVQQTTNPRIIEHPENQYVAKNEPATLNCKAEGDPPPDITWYRNGQSVITANENPSSHRMLLPSGQLFFLRIIHNKSNKPDVGTYYCIATNPVTGVSVRSRNATLEIGVIRDDFRMMPKDNDVAVGDSAVLECRGPKGSPEPRIRWKKGSEMLHAHGRIQILENGNLVLQDARKEDSGLYTCIAVNIAGEKESSAAQLSVKEKPRFEKSPQDILVEEHDEVEFQCQASGDPAPTIIWKREEGQIPQGRSHILEDRSLKIERVKVTDEGTYICRAENGVGYVEALARLTVHSHPTFLVTPQDKVVGVGRTVSLRCEVTGNPPPAVFWNKETSQILMFPRQDHGRFSVTDDGTLIIEPVRKEDAGEYVCQALSVAGSAYAKAKIGVRDVDPRPPPIIYQGPQNQTLPINSVAMLQCHSSGEPPPSIRWYKNGRLLTARDPRVTLLDSGTLQISDLRQADSALYMCKALSETGETTWSAALTVEAPTNPSVIFHRTPEPSTFPGAPSKPQVADISETSMRLMWKANANHGASPIIAYTVEYFSHETGEGWVVASDSIKGQTYTVRNLRPDTSYMFLVRARNSHGLSLPSQVAGPFHTGGSGGVRPTLQQYDIGLVSEKLSGAIIHMEPAEVISSTAIKLNWKILKSHRFLEGFHIKYRVLSEYNQKGGHKTSQHHRHVEFTVETLSSGSSTMYILRNLGKYTLYEVRVQPFYLTVEGQDSNAVRVRTYEDMPSAPPINIVGRMIDNHTLHLKWSPPPRDHQNGQLRGYKIFCLGNETKFHRNITTNATTHGIVVRHLVPGMTYRIQVAAFNRRGTGVRSGPYLIGGESAQGLIQGFVKEPWFIATLIGTIGGTLWFALCVFSVWLYRKKKARKKLHKNGVMTVPVHKTDDPSRLGSYFNTLNAPNYLQKDIANHVESLQPDVTNIRDARSAKEDAMKENLYNTPNVPSPPFKTFYNKANPVSCGPYATTTLVTSNNLLNQQRVPDSAFRPIQGPGGGQPGGFVPQGSGSSDSCMKQDASSDSNTDNSRHNTDYCLPPDEHIYDTTVPLVPGFGSGAAPWQQQDAYNYSPSEGGYNQLGELGFDPFAMGNYDDGRKNLGPKQPILFLPPPPEHPPPSDIGTPPDSPTAPRGMSPTSRLSENSGRYGGRNPMMHSTDIMADGGPVYAVHGHVPYSDGEYAMRSNPGGNSGSCPPDQRSFSPRSLSERRTHSPRCGSSDYGCGGENPAPGSSPPNPNRPPSPNKCRTMSPLSHLDSRAYSPRAMSEPERGPTPPVRAYKLIPLKDHDLQRHYSDGEAAPMPPIRMIGHNPPSPAPEDPMMDRACQSSLPSLVSECINRPDGVGNGSPLDPRSYMHDGRSSPPSELTDYHPDYPGEHGTRQDCASPDSSIGDPDTEVDTVTGSMLATWASITDNSNSCSSARSSALSSSDGSFFAEADFASAVAKAAELSGLTVVGSTVVDPNAGREREREKVRRPAKHRERAKRPTSPYSTDSNYSTVPVPRHPYPKSERKKQLVEQHKYKNQHGEHRQKVGGASRGRSSQSGGESRPGTDVPSYSRPNFPSPSGSSTYGYGYTPIPKERQRIGSSAKTPPHQNGMVDSQGLRTNPLTMAFDTKDTPIV